MEQTAESLFSFSRLSDWFIGVPGIAEAEIHLKRSLWSDETHHNA